MILVSFSLRQSGVELGHAVDQYRDENDKAGDGVLPEAIDADQIHAVLNDRDHDRAERGAQRDPVPPKRLTPPMTQAAIA